MTKNRRKRFFIGRDKYGSNVLVNFDRRTEDKTNSNILILGNSGQGKSYLMKLLLCNQLLGKGNTVAAVDELYLFLTNMTAIEYIRNGMKRVRKKESSFILASQNIGDFLMPQIKTFTKTL